MNMDYFLQILNRSHASGTFLRLGTLSHAQSCVIILDTILDFMVFNFLDEVSSLYLDINSLYGGLRMVLVVRTAYTLVAAFFR